MRKARQSASEHGILPEKARRSGSWLERRYRMNRHLRRFLVFVLVLILSAICLAGYAARYPLTLKFSSPVLAYETSGDVRYIVLLKSNSFSDTKTVGMDQLYLRDLTQAVRADFSYSYQGDRPTVVDYTYTIDAVVSVYDADDPSKVLMQKTISLKPATTHSTESKTIAFSDSVLISLGKYEKLVEEFQTATDQETVFDVQCIMAIDIQSYLAGGWHSIQETQTLSMPLMAEKFEITSSAGGQSPIRVFQPLRYQLVLADIPWFIYPAMAGVALLLMILLLASTQNIRKNRFWPKLRKMLKRASGQIMIIGDKAWEPQWCIAATEFNSLYRTARKLKHPIFCYIDRQSPAAYFYIYYGENNYCYIFGNPVEAKPSETPPVMDSPVRLPGDVIEEDPVEEQQPEPPVDDRIPLLPDTDDFEDILPSSESGDIRDLF